MKKRLMPGAALCLLLITITLSMSTCKKASSYPINLSGEWVDPYGYDGGSCTRMYISLPKDGHATYGTNDLDKGCDQKHWKGIARISDENFFVGTIKFTFVNKPEIYTGTDSVTVGNKKYKILAKMTLQNSLFHHKDIYTYVKYIDYQ